MSRKLIRNRENPTISTRRTSKQNRNGCHWLENGKRLTMLYSHWLWEKWFGPVPEGYVIHHKDGNSLNDWIENYDLLPRGRHIAIHRKKDETYMDLCRFLKQHNHLDSRRKDKSIKEWKLIPGDSDSEKLTYLYSQFNLNQQTLSKISGLDIALLSRAKDEKRNLSEKSEKKIIDAIFLWQSSKLTNENKIKCRGCGILLERKGKQKFCTPKCQMSFNHRKKRNIKHLVTHEGSLHEVELT